MRSVLSRCLSSTVVTVGLAIFSMLFGAGNLMFPISAGLASGQFLTAGMLGFCVTSVILPLIGLVAVILFNGDYNAFFGRLGSCAGKISIFLCLAAIGPFIVMPRIVTTAHTMMEPFLPHISILAFSAVFLLITFAATYRESAIINLLGHIISPALLVSLGIILVKGLLDPQPLMMIDSTWLATFCARLTDGYKTMDLLGTIFFSSIVLTLLRNNMPAERSSLSQLALIALRAGLLGCALLGIIYAGMGLLAGFHGAGLGNVNGAQMFSIISLRVMGNAGAIVIALAVLLACFSTIIALGAVTAEYTQKTLCGGRISFAAALALVLGLTAVISNFGLDGICAFSVPILDIGYPAIIMLTFVNIAYKMYGFTWVKLPVALTLVASAGYYAAHSGLLA